MEVILKQDLENIGFKNEIKVVKPGYARNYLIPRGFAVAATIVNKKVLSETLKQRAFKEEKIVGEYQQIADALQNTTIKIGAKVSSKGKIFGSVTTLQVAEGIHNEGYVVDRKNISIKEDAIKELGQYNAHIKLHKDVAFDLNFEVIKE